VPILVTCSCGKQFQTKDENAGRRARCPDCGHELIIPKPGGAGDIQDTPYLAPLNDPGHVPDVDPRTSGKAVASLVLGICSFVCSVFTGIPGIVLGILGLLDINRSRGAATGKGMAITGIVLSALSITLIPIVILIALLLPAVQAARLAGRRAVCGNNLKQIALAMHQYHQAYGVLPPRWTVDPQGKPLLSWRVLLLPYIEQNALYQKFKLDEPWDSPTNKSLVDQMPSSYRCPSLPIPNSGTTVYQVLLGPGTMFEKAEGISFGEVTDGRSNTLMVVETKAASPWTQPSCIDYTPKAPIPQLGSAHPGGFNAALGDGSVRFFKDPVPTTTLDAMATRNGGEIIPASSD